MSPSTPPPGALHRLVSYFRSGNAIRSRSVSHVILAGAVDVPAPTARLVADWQRETLLLPGFEPGDVDVLSLVRARARWPEYRRCVQTVSDWAQGHGLPDVMASANVALMTCRGARYHHDAAQYGGVVFCNLFMSDDKGLDLHFPATGLRIPVVRGTVVIFDTGQPHGLVARNKGSFDVADFPVTRDCTQVFLTWELPVEEPEVASLLGIDFDIGSELSPPRDEGQLWRNGVRVSVCPESGLWCGADPDLFAIDRPR